jgi:hypothetical protein
MDFRKYLTTVIFIALLIFGPINDSWPVWLVIRIGYLILIPTIIWFILRWIWDKCQPRRRLEQILERGLSILIGCILIFYSIFEFFSDTHIGNTQWIRTRDGMEAVGDDIILKGPDYGIIITLIIVSLFFFWHGFFYKYDKKQH